MNFLFVAFDNNQVIQKTWMFKYGGKQVVSTVTTIACYENLRENTEFQFKTQIPTALFPTEANKKELLSRIKQLSEDAGRSNRHYRQQFIEARIKKVAHECSLTNGEVQDHILLGTGSEGLVDDVFNYSHVPSKSRNSSVMDMPCLPENPNSYRSVSCVLDNILTLVQDRNYIPVYMDGSPYGICMNLVREAYICDICGVDLKSEVVETHVKAVHNIENVKKWSRKYKKILIRPGMCFYIKFYCYF